MKTEPTQLGRCNRSVRRVISTVLLVLMLLVSACGPSSVMASIENEGGAAPTSRGSTIGVLGGGGGGSTGIARDGTPVLAYYYGEEKQLDMYVRVLKRDIVVLFADGRATRDTVSLTDPDAVAEDRWSTYESRGVSDLKVGSKRYDFYVPLENPGGSFTLSKCFSGYTSGNTAFTFRTICFDSDGRFEKSSATRIETPFTTGTSIPPDSYGTYAIDGYRIALNFADGTNQELAFGVVDEEQSQIIIGGQDYFG